MRKLGPEKVNELLLVLQFVVDFFLLLTSSELSIPAVFPAVRDLDKFLKVYFIRRNKLEIRIK